MFKQKQTFCADIFGQTYEFRHDPWTATVWIIRRLNQPADELLDERPVIFPRRRMTHQQMVEWYTDQLIRDRARADEREWYAHDRAKAERRANERASDE